MGVGSSIVLIAIGAILDFAVDVHTTVVDLQTVGLILMIVGAVGLVVSIIFWRSWGGYHRSRRVVHDGPDTYVEESGRY